MKLSKDQVRQHYVEHQDEIQSRLSEFRALRNASDERLFEELTFVILTSQSSAKNSWEACQKLKEHQLLTSPKQQKIAEILRQNQIQFEERKAEYIKTNFDFLSQPTFADSSTELKISARINPKNLDKTREWIVSNINGLSWKGASHFLRNIGHGKEFAIFSQHTVSVLFDLEVLKISEPPKNEKRYLEAEKKVQSFSQDIGIDIQALDLVLWSYKTGEIFK